MVGPALLAVGVGSVLKRSRGKVPLSSIAAIIGGAALTETVFTRVCLAYGLLGIDTRRRDEKKRAMIGEAPKPKGELPIRIASERESRL